MADTERIELPGGNWWEIRTVVTRRMRKEFRKAALKGFGDLMGVDLTDTEAVQKAILANPDRWDVDAVADAYLLHGTIGYSFGAQVDMATIDGLPEAYVEAVLARMQELYAEMPAEKRKGFFGPPS